MSTNCTIARYNPKNKNIEVNTIYFDGYLEGVGNILKNRYNEKNIDQLFVNKQIKSLEKNEKEPIIFFPDEYKDIIKMLDIHKYVNYLDQKDSPIQFYIFNYLFIKNTWFCYNRKDNDWFVLSDVIINSHNNIGKSPDVIIEENNLTTYTTQILNEFSKSRHKKIERFLTWFKTKKIKLLKKTKIDINI